MDMSVVFMWLVRGFDGVVNLTNKMLDEGLIPGDGPYQHCVWIRDEMEKLVKRMQEVNAK